jgi:hypothetical protein
MIRFDGFEIYIVPDDDAEAAKIYSAEVLACTTQTAVAMQKRPARMYVRRSLWDKMKPELERLGKVEL